MMKKNTFKLLFILILICFNFQLVFTETVPPITKDTVYIGDFEINILKTNHIDFIHAELVILYQTKDIDSVIPFMTARTIFTKNIQSKTAISKALRALGNDFEIQFMGDHLIFKINFLKKNFPKFIKFLSVLYKTNLLSEKDLLYEKERIIEDYKSNSFFKKKMGVYAAYKFLFKGQILGNNFFTLDQINKCEINHVIVHYKGSYTPKNSSLFITGKVNTERMIGYISKFLRNVPKRFRQVIKKKKTSIFKMQRPIILNIPDASVATIIYLKIVEIDNKDNYIQNLIINDVLFKQNIFKAINNKPRIFRFRRDLFIKTDVLNHKGLVTISNSTQINYNSIGKFLVLLYDEVRKIKINSISRRSYKKVFNFLYGRFKVNSGNYYNVIETEIKKFLFAQSSINYVSPNRKLLISVNNLLNEEKKNIIKNKSNFLKNEAIVIIGDLNKILKFYPKIDAEIVHAKDL